MLRKANINSTSATKITLASSEGQPPISGLRNRAIAMPLRRTKKTTQASTTRAASTSNVPMRTSYSGPRKANTRWVPNRPSITISSNSMLMTTNPVNQDVHDAGHRSGHHLALAQGHAGHHLPTVRSPV